MKLLLAIVLATLVVATGMPGAETSHYSPREKAYYADPRVVQFVRPGLTVTILSANIASDGTISVVYTITDPAGLTLDNTGVGTPGVVSLSFVAAVLPNNQEQYTAYTTRAATGAVSGTVNQAGADTGGVITQTAAGSYQYVFATKAPSGFDATATHTIGIYGSRNLTVYNLGTNYATTTFNFVPNGAAVTNTRDIVKTATCNNCHDQLSAHGGSRRAVELCIMCHTPQTTSPANGNTVDFKVFIHKVHMGSQLPSVIAGTPYQIINSFGTSDWSTVVFPADPRRCESCHDQNAGAKQATAYLTRPSRAACGSCHDDVNFASGVNHAGGPQIDDTQCANCHIPQGELDFDASIKGAHVVPTESRMLSGLIVNLTNITGGTAGSKPVVTFTVKDSSGNGVPLSQLGTLALTMAGPTSDYGYTSFGSDVTTTPGYVSEDATVASCDASGACAYTFTHAVPANATGTYTIGVEARRTETLLPGTTASQSVEYGATNKVMSFSVDSSPLVLRRAVVATANCNKCHSSLSVHGTLRNQTEYCVLCHNPSNTDFTQRPSAVVAADKALPPQGINFNLLVHRIHNGVTLQADNRSYVVVGFGGSHNDFTNGPGGTGLMGTQFPAMSPTGALADLANCSMCHINGSEQNLPLGLNAVTDPQGPINPIQPIGSACTGCHADLSTASHVLANTTSLGESCQTCHASGADFSVTQVHAQY
jgi:OmcA/MtrC family decaheme c-type cytochrome